MNDELVKGTLGMKRKKRRKRLKHGGGIGMGIAVLAMLVFSLFVVGANGFMADIDFKSRSEHSRSQVMSKYEMIAETELGSSSNGIRILSR